MSKHSDFRFDLQELAGAVGDYSTLFPIVLGVTIVSGLDLGHMLLFFAIWYILTGLIYRAPIPVEPMKVVGAVIIAGSLTTGEIAAAGLVLGVFFLFLGFMGGMKWLRRHIPNEVIRGIQLGLALILLRTAAGYVTMDLSVALVGTGIILLFAYLSARRGISDVSSLLVLVLGLAIGLYLHGMPPVTLMKLPTVVVPSIPDFTVGTLDLVIPQIPLTVTNSILATALLMQDLLNRDIDPDKLSKTVGLMNLTAPVMGGMPMCHGAGGLAAQYRYGARTGGSNIMSGVILIPIALFFSSPEFVALLPMGIFGALLVFVALELGKHGMKTKSYPVSVSMAVIALLLNMTAAFVVGMVAMYLLGKLSK